MNINYISSAQSGIKLQAIRVRWELKNRGNSAEVVDDGRGRLHEMRDQFEKLHKDNTLALIDGKLRAGQELSSKELELLKKENPELYEEALEIKRERRQYRKMLETRRTKKEVQNLHLHKMNRLLNEAASIRKAPGIDSEKKRMLTDKLSRRMAAIQNEYAVYTASNKYLLLPRDEKDKKAPLTKKQKALDLKV